MYFHLQNDVSSPQLSYRSYVLLPLHGFISHWCSTCKCLVHYIISHNRRGFLISCLLTMPIRSSRDPRQPIRTFHTMFGHPRLESCCPVQKETRALRVSLTTLTETAPSSETLSQTSQNSSPFNPWVCACVSFPEYWPTVRLSYLFPTGVLCM